MYKKQAEFNLLMEAASKLLSEGEAHGAMVFVYEDKTGDGFVGGGGIHHPDNDNQIVLRLGNIIGHGLKDMTKRDEIVKGIAEALDDEDGGENVSQDEAFN